MQEEIEQKTVTLAINTTKLTGRVLKDAITKLLRHLENSQSKEVIPRGNQTVKQLIGQNQGVTNIEITDSGIKDFERVARKYGVDYAVKKDRSGDNPRYLVFFKARDNDALIEIMRFFSNKFFIGVEKHFFHRIVVYPCMSNTREKIYSAKVENPNYQSV